MKSFVISALFVGEKSPPRMLKMLGLVCKESSGTGSDTDSVDKVKLPGSYNYSI